MKKAPIEFNVGDLVFAKVRGYPAWPARIMAECDKRTQKFKVRFYGTYETADCKASEMWIVTDETKAKYGKNKKKNFLEGMNELESNPDILLELENEKPIAINEDADTTADMTVDSNLDESEANASVSTEATPAVKPKKRKAEKTPGSAPPAKQPRVKKTPVTETKVSRSGRAIKSKMVIEDEDEDGEEETPLKKAATPRTTKSPAAASNQKKMWICIKSSGQIVELNLDKNRPLEFDTKAKEIQWDREAALNLLKIKDGLETGKYIPEELVQELERKASLSEEEKKFLEAARRSEIRQEKMAFLRTEQNLYNLHRDLFSALPMEDPNPSAAFEILKEMEALPLAPLMFKKRPEVVNTLRRLRKYVGPNDHNVDQKDTKRVRTAAENVLKKIENMFDFGKDGGDFFKQFESAIDEFKKVTSGLEEKPFNLLTSDPTVKAPVTA